MTDPPRLVAYVNVLDTSMRLARAAELHAWSCEQEHCSAATLELYTTVHRQYLRFLVSVGQTDPQWSELNALRVLEFQQWLRKRPGHKPPSASTVAQYTAILKTWSATITNMFQTDESSLKDPLRNVKIPRVPKRVPKYLEPSQFDQLVSACLTTEFPLRNMAILHLFGDTGMRVNELVHADEGQVVFYKASEILNRESAFGQITVVMKGDVERVLAFGGECKRALERYLRSDEERNRRRVKSERTLFLSNALRPMSTDSVRYLLHQLQARAGLPMRVHPHLIRSSFATWQAQRGVDPLTLQRQMGHSSWTVTQRYISPVVDPVRGYTSPLSHQALVKRRSGER